MINDDAAIEVGGDHPIRLSADALRALRKGSGRTLTELLNVPEDDAEGQADKFQVMAFAELYRREVRGGHMPDAGTLWERAGRVELDFVVAERDPTPGESSTDSPPSVATGG